MFSNIFCEIGVKKSIICTFFKCWSVKIYHGWILKVCILWVCFLMSMFCLCFLGRYRLCWCEGEVYLYVWLLFIKNSIYLNWKSRSLLLTDIVIDSFFCTKMHQEQEIVMIYNIYLRLFAIFVWLIRCREGHILVSAFLQLNLHLFGLQVDATFLMIETLHGIDD